MKAKVGPVEAEITEEDYKKFIDGLKKNSHLYCQRKKKLQTLIRKKAVVMQRKVKLLLIKVIKNLLIKILKAIQKNILKI